MLYSFEDRRVSRPAFPLPIFCIASQRLSEQPSSGQYPRGRRTYCCTRSFSFLFCQKSIHAAVHSSTRSFVVVWEWVRSPHCPRPTIVHVKLRKLKHDQTTNNAVSPSFGPVFDCLPPGIYSHRVCGKLSGRGAIWGGAPGYCCRHPGKRHVTGTCTTSTPVCQKA